ncbi:MAG TPA: hypothetical protein VFA19_07380 [Gaiellaceae bacterium]|nr:hypothetical protein [Gaiellaceae bacterium]
MAAGGKPALYHRATTRERAGWAELVAGSSEDGGDVAGRVFYRAEFGHRAQVLEFEFGHSFGADPEERFVEFASTARCASSATLAGGGAVTYRRFSF